MKRDGKSTNTEVTHRYACSRKEVLGYWKIAKEYCTVLSNFASDLILYTKKEHRVKVYELIWSKRVGLDNWLYCIVENVAELSVLESAMYEVLYIKNKNTLEIVAPLMLYNDGLKLNDSIATVLSIKQDIICKVLKYLSRELLKCENVFDESKKDFQVNVESMRYIGKDDENSSKDNINFKGFIDCYNLNRNRNRNRNSNINQNYEISVKHFDFWDEHCIRNGNRYENKPFLLIKIGEGIEEIRDDNKYVVQCIIIKNNNQCKYAIDEKTFEKCTYLKNITIMSREKNDSFDLDDGVTIEQIEEMNKLLK